MILGDNPDHITWCLKTAQERAKSFNISGITYSLTQGVVKNIIPAIASTNAIVAAACANEAYKIATNCANYVNNYMVLALTHGVDVCWGSRDIHLYVRVAKKDGVLCMRISTMAN